MRGHATKPQGRNQLEMLAIERPFVERHFDGPTADEHADAHEQAQRVDLPARQRQLPAMSGGEEMNLQEAECVTEPVPPEAQRADLEEHRIDGVDVRTQHEVRLETALDQERRTGRRPDRCRSRYWRLFQTRSNSRAITVCPAFVG